MLDSHPRLVAGALPATVYQQLTGFAADFAVAWTVGVVAGLMARIVLPASTVAPLVALGVAALASHAANAIVLAGATGQGVGARVAQTAEVCPRTGRPVGVRRMAHLFFTRIGGYDPRTVVVSLDRG